MIHGLTGIILAGGKSRRFGSNKALAVWEGGTLIETAAKSLLRVMPKVIVVAKETGPLDFMKAGGINVIEDDFSEDHPMGGLYTGLTHMNTPHAFVCACDMPFIEPKLIESLWEARSDYAAVIPIWNGARQPLCGIYSRECSGVIRQSIRKGLVGISALFDVMQTRFFLEEEIRRADPEGLSLLDIDTRQDWLRAQKKFGSR